LKLLNRKALAFYPIKNQPFVVTGKAYCVVGEKTWYRSDRTLLLPKKLSDNHRTAYVSKCNTNLQIQQHFVTFRLRHWAYYGDSKLSVICQIVRAYSLTPLQIYHIPRESPLSEPNLIRAPDSSNKRKQRNPNWIIRLYNLARCRT